MHAKWRLQTCVHMCTAQLPIVGVTYLCANYRQSPCLSSFICQAKYLFPSRWLHRHIEKAEFEVEETGADLVNITCVKTATWHDIMVQRYRRQCAWLAAITEATKQVCCARLLVLLPLAS